MPSTIDKCKLFRIKHNTLLEGETFLINKHKTAFFEMKCTFFGRKENTISRNPEWMIVMTNYVLCMHLDCYGITVCLWISFSPPCVVHNFLNIKSFNILKCICKLLLSIFNILLSTLIGFFLQWCAKLCNEFSNPKPFCVESAGITQIL